jgi:hypothetical protein
MSVYWLISASETLRKSTHALQLLDPGAFAQMQEEFSRILADVFPGQVVIVREQLSGYRDFDGLGILLVEVQPVPGKRATTSLFHSPCVYIVKVAVGHRLKDLQRELQAWDSSRPEYLRSDNIFVSLDPFPARGHGEPRALIYGDATTVLGSQNVMSLEEAIMRSCRYGQPRPQSITRLLRSLYERLGTHFFSCSSLVEPAQYLAPDSRPALTDVLLQWREKRVAGCFDPLAAAPPIQAQPNDVNRQQVRREVLALLGREYDSYADPVDLLTGFWENRDAAGFLPAVRRGRAHGDLHARNVEVAIVDDEVAHCALFDYENMRDNNFVAWDFIKLEVELAARMLTLCADQEWPNFVRQCLTYWRFVAAGTDEFDRYHSVAADSDIDAIDEAIVLPRDPRLAEDAMKLAKPLLRLARGVISLRRIAKQHLGGGFNWLREYDFLMLWYATRAGLYPNYEDKMTAAALIGAGVSGRRLVSEQVASPGPERQVGETSHRPRFLHARRVAQSGEATGLQQGVELLETLRNSFPHVLEIDEELALCYIEQKNYAAAETLLHSIDARYRHTTAESPSRMGSLWKRRAVMSHPFNVQALHESLKWYRLAEAIRDEYFPAINVATILWLLGNRAASRKQAARVLEILAQVDRSKDPFWPQATQGEALLLIGEDPQLAFQCYAQAASDNDCTPRDRQSMRRQLEWLRPHLEPATQSAIADDLLDQLFVRAS